MASVLGAEWLYTPCPIVRSTKVCNCLILLAHALPEDSIVLLWIGVLGLHWEMGSLKINTTKRGDPTILPLV